MEGRIDQEIVLVVFEPLRQIVADLYCRLVIDASRRALLPLLRRQVHRLFRLLHPDEVFELALGSYVHPEGLLLQLQADDQFNVGLLGPRPQLQSVHHLPRIDLVPLRVSDDRRVLRILPLLHRALVSGVFIRAY